jgi:hypothetical protein
MNDDTNTAEPAQRDWLSIARDSFSASTSYMDTNWRKTWEDNLALFQSRHPAGSKYNSDLFKARSRIFRPKTRSVVRKNEAAAAEAFFSNVDVVSVEAENQSNPIQQASAEVMFQLLNYRLQKSIPWFKLLIGAFQESQIYGIVASYQYWDYREKPQYIAGVDQAGNQVTYEGDPKVVRDKPCVELIPLENLRFDPGANWLDVVGSTPYLIRQVPKYVGDVKQMMATPDTKTGQPVWRPLSDGEIRQAMADYDSLRQQRENRREDPKAENNAPLSDIEIVWCHENFVRLDGEEMVYWTMGCMHMLTDPVPLDQVYFTGERPVVIGNATIEAHRPVPDALVQLGAQLQREANDVVNQRLDNVKLVLNKRWIAKRGKQVDIPSLQRNVAGSVTLVDSIDDVQEVNWPDVTASAYAEQDRINGDFDELVGNFSGSSIASNRKLGETVGGLNLLNGGASQLTGYLLRTFVETWVEPVLRQLVKLEQQYETDMTVLALAGQKAQLMQKYGIDQVTDEMLNQELTVMVNVGMGATNPEMKLQKFVLATKTYAEARQALPDADPLAIRKEIFGLAGYRDGARFFREDGDPMQQQMQQMQQMLQQAQAGMEQMQAEIATLKRDNAAKAVQALSDADLKQAQTVKTLAEAAILPSQQLMQQAITPEGVGNEQ